MSEEYPTWMPQKWWQDKCNAQAKRIEELEHHLRRFIHRAESEVGVEDWYNSVSYLIDELAEAKKALEVKQ